MKFVCLNCETYMNFEKVEKPGEDTLGVFFGCPSCNAKFSMVTNPGETQMVSALGVKLGGRTRSTAPGGGGCSHGRNNCHAWREVQQRLPLLCDGD